MELLGAVGFSRKKETGMRVRNAGGTHSGAENLNPKNSNNVSNVVMFIISAFCRNISPRISYPPAPNQKHQPRMFGLNGVK